MCVSRARADAGMLSPLHMRAVGAILAATPSRSRSHYRPSMPLLLALETVLPDWLRVPARHGLQPSRGSVEREMVCC